MSARAFYRAMLVSDFVMEYLGKRAPGPLTEQDRIKVLFITNYGIHFYCTYYLSTWFMFEYWMFLIIGQKSLEKY